MRSAFLILHGIENHRPPGHWQFQLAAKLSALGHQVLYPGLPDADAPRYAAWEEALLAGLGELDPTVPRVAVCHSLSCLLWLRAAPAIPEALRPDKLMLVAPPAASELPPGGAEFGEFTLDPQAVRASVRGELVFVGSGDDPYNPPGPGHVDYAGQLGLTTSEFPGGGHFTPDDGYGTWPFVADWCIGHH